MRFCYHTIPTTTPYDIQGNYPNMSGGVQRKEGWIYKFSCKFKRSPLLILRTAYYWKWVRGKVVTAYRTFHNTLNLRYEYVGYKTNSNGRKDSSQLCPAALTLILFQCLLKVQCSQICDCFIRNTRILLYTPATVLLSLLKRFINSSVLPLLYYLTFFIHICRIPLSPTLPLVFHETNSLRHSQFNLSFFSFSSYYFLPFPSDFPLFSSILYSRISLSRPGNDTCSSRLFPIPPDKCQASTLTHCGRVTQICVFTLQLCKTDEANLRFQHALGFHALYI